MSLRSEIYAAFKKDPTGILMDDLFNMCPSAEDEGKFRANVSVLKGEGKIIVVSTTDEPKPRPLYGIGNWSDLPAIKPKQGAPKKDHKPRPERDDPKKKRNGGANPPAPAPTRPPEEIGAHFGISAEGELGIEKDEAKIKLNRAEFAVLRLFVEKTEDVWK